MKLLALCENRFVRIKILASLRKEARRAWRKAIETTQEEDWEAQKLGLAYFKKAIRRPKRDSRHSFVESMNSQTPTARLDYSKE